MVATSHGFAEGEAHRARFLALLGCTLAHSGGWLLVAHPTLQWPLFNYACPLGAEGPPDPAPAIAWLAERGRLHCFLCPAEWAGPPGLSLLEEQTVVWAQAPPASMPPLPAGVKVWPVPAPLTELWVDLMLDGFGIPAELRAPAAAAWAGARARLAPGERLELYLAEVDGSPAGTGALYIDATGTAGLYGGSVLAPWRRRGVGRALVAHRLAAAFRAGAAAAVTQTQAGGAIARTWRALGYRLAYHVRCWYGIPAATGG